MAPLKGVALKSDSAVSQRKLPPRSFDAAVLRERHLQDILTVTAVTAVSFEDGNSQFPG
jgi:hypothetical protein